MEQQTRRERQAAGIAAVLFDPKKQAEKYKGRPAGSTKAKPARARRLRERALTMLEIADAMRVSRDTVQRYLKMTSVECV